MPYQKTAWQDHYQDPATGEVLQQGTPVDAEHLNKIEQGIFDAQEAAAQAGETAGGKAPAVHTHDDRYYTEAEVNALIQAVRTGLSDGSIKPAAAGAADTAASAGAVPWSGVTGKPGTFVPSGHTHPASQVTAGMLPAGVLATNSTDYGTSRLRNIRAGTADLTPGASALANGEIYLVYE